MILVLIWARLPVARVHAAAQRSMGEAGRNGRKRSCAQPLTARTALVSLDQQQSRPPLRYAACLATLDSEHDVVEFVPKGSPPVLIVFFLSMLPLSYAAFRRVCREDA